MLSALLPGMRNGADQHRLQGRGTSPWSGGSPDTLHAGTSTPSQRSSGQGNGPVLEGLCFLGDGIQGHPNPTQPWAQNLGPLCNETISLWELSRWEMS